MIARLWVTHHAIFEHIKAYNRPLLFLNLGWAFTIVFLPLPTEMISQFATSPITVSLYIGTMALSSLALTTMVLLIRRQPLIGLEGNPIEGSGIFASIATTVAFIFALILGSFIPFINLWALLLLFLTGPAQRIYNRRTEFRRLGQATSESDGP